MIEAKYEGSDMWYQSGDVTHCQAAENFADRNGQEPADGERIIVTRDIRSRDTVVRHRVRVDLVYTVVPLREGS